MAEGSDRVWDFFISYTQADRAWAEWIAWILEEDRYRVLVQAWDFVPGTNWTQSMQEGVTSAVRTIAVLSENYLHSQYGSAEWLSAWRADPDGKQRKLLPVRVQNCPLPGLLSNIVRVDVFDLGEADARAVLRKAIADVIAGRAKPDRAPSFPGDGRAVPRQAEFPHALPTVWKVPARNPSFTGRDAPLAVLARGLSSGSTAAVYSVRGPGGVGKTQLATEYAYLHATEYDVVWLIAAQDATTIPDQFAALARALGRSLTAADSHDLRDMVHDALRDTTGWLLIFDSAESVADIQSWLPSFPLPAGTPGHVIVTTREDGFDRIGPVLDLDVLDLPSAVRLLRTRVPALGQDIAEQLASQLGRLPLALDQAAAYIDRTGLPAADYLRLLRTALIVLAEGAAQGHSLSPVWSLSLDRVAGEAPEAMELLDICAYVAPDAVPLDLFTRHPRELPPALGRAVLDPFAFNRAIARLVDYSLVKRTPAGLQVHRLVQHDIRFRHRYRGVSTQPKPLLVVLNLLRVDLPEMRMVEPRDWPRWAALLPHVLVALDHLQSRHLDNVTAETASWLLDRAGLYLKLHGRAQEARPLAERAVAAAEAAYGSGDPVVADYLNNLALILQDLGEFAQARSITERALVITEAARGPNHPAIAAYLTNLAAIMSRLGELTAARPVAERALAITEAAYGPGHPFVAGPMINLALIVQNMGNVAAARPLAERALAILEAAYGPNHPDVAIRLINLATILRALDEPAAAQALFDRARAIKSR